MPAGSLRFCAWALFLAALSPGSTASAQPRAEGACAPGVEGCYRGGRGPWRSAGDDYDLLHERPDPDRLRTALEMVAALGGGTVWYWLDRERNVADWDYESIEQRFTLDAFRYDNNDFPINFIWHPLSGSAFHAFSRANDLGLLESVGWSLAASFAWEFLLEFKERISVNDILVTTGAGTALGEFMHRLGQHLRGSHPVLRWVFGFPVTFHDALDGGPSPAVPPMWHRFRLAYDAGAQRVDGGGATFVQGLAFDGAFVAIPGYLADGTFDRLFAEADFVSLRARAGLGEGASLDVLADTLLLGWYHQSLSGRSGESAALGAALSFLYRNEHHGGWDDRVSLLGLPGPAFDVEALAGPTRLRLSGRLSPTFGGIHSAPYPAWADAHPDQTAKSILRKQGYYYGWGWWGRLEASLTLGALELGGSVAWASLDSHEGLDRTQSAVTADVLANDRLLEWEAYARLSVLPFGGFVQITTSRRMRTGDVERLSSERSLSHVRGAAGIDF